MKITQEDMEDVVFQETISDWGDFIEVKSGLENISSYGIATTVNFNSRKDVAYVKVLENVGNAFLVNVEQIIPVRCVTLIKDEDIDEWRVFSFGNAIDPYIDRD